MRIPHPHHVHFASGLTGRAITKVRPVVKEVATAARRAPKPKKINKKAVKVYKQTLINGEGPKRERKKTARLARKSVKDNMQAKSLERKVARRKIAVKIATEVTKRDPSELI